MSETRAEAMAAQPGGSALSRLGGRVFTPSLGAVPFTVLTAAMVGVPTVILTLYSVWKPAFFTVVYEFTTENYTTIWTNRVYFTLLLKSLGIGLVVAALTTALGFVLAYAITFRFRRVGMLILGAVVATMLASYLVRIYAWTTILGTNGVINTALEWTGLIAEPVRFLLYGYFAIVVVMVYVYLPIAVLPMYAGLQDIGKDVLAAGRDLGASPRRVFRTVTLPLATPGVRTAFVLVFILAATDYVTPGLVGGTSGQMIGTIIYSQFGLASNYPQASALAVASVLSIAVAYVLLIVGWKLARPAVRAIRLPSLPRRSVTRPPGALRVLVSRLPVLEGVTVLLLLFLAAPIVVVGVFSFNDSTSPSLPFLGFTLEWWRSTYADETFIEALITSVKVAGASVGAGLLVGVPAAYALAYGLRRSKKGFEALVFLPAAMPGVVFGVAVLTTAVLFNITLGLGVTMAAHTLLVAPFIILVVRARLLSLDPRLRDAARDLGAGRRRVLGTIDIPLIATTLIGASILAAAISLDNVVVTNFTIGAAATVPTYLFASLQSSSTPGLNVIAITQLVVPLMIVILVVAALRSRLTRAVANVSTKERGS